MTEPQDLQKSIEVEDTIIGLLASVWAMYDSLPVLHRLDKPSFQEALHKAQAIVLARPKMRGILMAQQGIAPQQPTKSITSPSATNPPVANQSVASLPVANQSVEVDSLSDQPVNIPLKMGEKACAIPIRGSGGMKTLPGTQ